MIRQLAFAALFAGLVSLTTAAPVPPPLPPRPLTPELLVGTWHYEYGTMREGWIALYRDHHYFAQHNPGNLAYVGRWWVDGDSLMLSEKSYLIDMNEVTSGPRLYEFRLSTKGYPYLAGESTGGVRVVLSDPNRETP